MHPSSANTVLQVSVAPLVSKARNLRAKSEKHLKEYAILSMLCEACFVARRTERKLTAIFENRKCSAMIEYKGYIGDVVFDPEIDAFHGTVININDVIAFYGSSVTELREDMQKSIEAYFAFCKEQGREPEEPLSDEALVQVAVASFIELDKTEARGAESKLKRSHDGTSQL